MKWYEIAPGDRVGFRKPDGTTVTRTVEQVGDGYAVISYQRELIKVPMHRITSHIRVDKMTDRHQASNARVANSRRVA